MATKAAERKRVWTYNELLAEKTETNQPTELWEGDLVMTPSPVAQHQRISFRVARLLAQFVSMHQLGEVLLAPLDVVLTPRRVVQPDIVYVSHARQEIIQDQIHGAPDLIVEVVSPGTWRRDHIEKKALYEQFSVAEYWIVDREGGMIEVFAMEQGSYRLIGRFGHGERARSSVLAGFEVQVDEVLA